SNDDYGTYLGKKLNADECQFIYLRDKDVKTTELLRWLLYGLGFIFEHSIPDRNDYIIVYKNNIESSINGYVNIRFEKDKSVSGIILCNFGRNGTFISEDNYVLISTSGMTPSRYFRIMYKEIQPSTIYNQII
ncbi:Metallopeptidase, catalytic domain-containing protein, partial [Strongyloides ratti]